MIALLLLGLAQPATAIEAERAFAAMAQTEGQSRAFRHYADEQGILFAPEARNARDMLRDAPDPPVAVMWWPAQSWLSCDGALAVNTGPWLRGGGRSAGTFTTVWTRRADGEWRWLLDHGRETPRAVPAGDSPRVERATCARPADPSRLPPPLQGRRTLAELVRGASGELVVQEEGRMPGARPAEAAAFRLGATIASGRSADSTLAWRVQAIDGARPGARLFTLHRWDGNGYRLALIELTGVGES